MNVIPDPARSRQLPLRAGPHARGGRGAPARADRRPRRAEITGNSGSGAVAVDHPLARKLIEAGDLAVAPKQAWTPVAEFAAARVPRGQLRPGRHRAGAPARRAIEIAALLRSFQVLEAFGT